MIGNGAKKLSAITALHIALRVRLQCCGNVDLITSLLLLQVRISHANSCFTYNVRGKNREWWGLAAIWDRSEHFFPDNDLTIGKGKV